MSEVYRGVKFKTIFLEKNIIKNKKIKELIKYGRKFAELGLSPKYDGGSAGNLSFRTKDGFITTSSRSDLSCLKKEKFAEVIDCNFNKKEVYLKGLKEPSSETFLHYSIYKRRKDINVIFHVHDNDALKHAKELKIPVTHEKKFYGTIELSNEAIKILKNNDYIALKGHGIVAMGKTIEETAKLILKKFGEGKRLER